MSTVWVTQSGYEEGGEILSEQICGIYTTFEEAKKYVTVNSIDWKPVEDKLATVEPGADSNEDPGFLWVHKTTIQGKTWFIRVSEWKLLEKNGMSGRWFYRHDLSRKRTSRSQDRRTFPVEDDV